MTVRTPSKWSQSLKNSKRSRALVAFDVTIKVNQSIFLLLLGVACLCLIACQKNSLDSSVRPVNLPAEIERARAENKLLVLEFMGSDWCPTCIEFHEKVVSRPEFARYANSNLVWLEIDFPQKTKLPDEVNATND